jgi:hypothetical protein
LGEKKSPNEKIQSLTEMIEVIRKSVSGKVLKEGQEEELLEVILAYCIIHAQPNKLLSTIKYRKYNTVS